MDFNNKLGSTCTNMFFLVIKQYNSCSIRYSINETQYFYWNLNI